MQAAKQQSWLLNACPTQFQHDTCSNYCYLYPTTVTAAGTFGPCSVFTRILYYYKGSWTNVGENVAKDSQLANPLRVLQLVGGGWWWCGGGVMLMAKQMTDEYLLLFNNLHSIHYEIRRILGFTGCS